MKRRFISAIATFFLCACVCAQSSSVSEDKDSLRRMLANQPDYTAMQRFVFSEGVGGFGANSKVIKMGARHAEVTEETIFISEAGKPLIKIFPKRREYSELQLPETDDFAVSPEDLAKRTDTIIESRGTEKVAEYTCLKIEVSYKDEKLKEVKFLFWVAPALKNLVIKSETSVSRQVKFLMVLKMFPSR